MFINVEVSGCCGLSCMWNYGGGTNEVKDSLANHNDSLNYDEDEVYEDGCVALYCVFTKSQLTDSNNRLSKNLKKSGFELIKSWTNFNSGNKLFMFILTTGDEPDEKWWYDL